MVRTIVSHPQLAGAPLDELKQFLSITVPREDALLEQMLRAAHSLCENFTGLTLLETSFDETLSTAADWQSLTAKPVFSFVEARLINPDGSSELLETADYETRISANGHAAVRLKKAVTAHRMTIRVIARTASSWDGLPADLRHGLIRLAAHSYRERDAGPLASPPASVAALWRPHRRLSL